MGKETYVAVCRKHWSVFLGRGFWTILFLSIAGYCFFSTSESEDMKFAGYICLVVAAVFLISAIISYRSEYLALTESKLIGHIGFIKSKKLSTPINRIQNVGISNGLFGKIFNYHTITIDNAGTGNTEFVFKRMANAKAFAEKVELLTTQK